MVRPIKVQAGEWDEEVTDLVEKARELDVRLEKATTETDNSELRDVRGVTEVRPAHYYTNQQLPDTPEDVSKTTQSSGEGVRFLQANPHADGGALSAHVTEGGPPDRPAGITNEKTLFGKAEKCPCEGCPASECQCKKGCTECECKSVKKSQLLGAWQEDNPFVLRELAEKAESLARRL